MDFNSSTFLFIFIPIFFSIFFIAKSTYRKWIILVASVILYAWFQKFNAIVVIGLILINYFVLNILKKKVKKVNRVRFYSIQ